MGNARFPRTEHSSGKASRPIKFLNPTTIHYSLYTNSPDPAQITALSNVLEEGKLLPANGQSETRAETLQRKWRSRDNRKGRHTLSISQPHLKNARYVTPPKTNTLKETLKGIIRMFTTYPYWDVSYLVAVVFTWGSVVWCINAFFVWLPLQDPSTEFDGEIANGGGISAFIGATIFEFGSVLLMIEAVNENRAECFGWAFEEALGERGIIRVKPGHCIHHQGNKHNFVKTSNEVLENPDHNAVEKPQDRSTSSKRTWTWLPSWYELRTHYLKEIGFLACLSQMLGATVFWISGFTALPVIYNRLTTPAALNGAYWAPQVIGGTGFIISGTLFMLETQKKWYMPAFGVLGWHIGAWNLLGGIGFTLCGALGFASANSGAVYEGSLATFWGSWCFLIGSVIQWYESLDKHPVEVEAAKGIAKEANDEEASVTQEST